MRDEDYIDRDGKRWNETDQKQTMLGGKERRGIARYALARYGMARYGMARYGLARYRMEQTNVETSSFLPVRRMEADGDGK